jgi:hypothetical protein
MTRHLKWLAPLGVAGISLLAACGSSPGGAAQVASLAGDATTTTTAAASGNADNPDNADAEQAMLDFAKCMREHGIDMPDPQFNGDGGGVFIAGKEGADSPQDKTKLDEAQTACQSYLDKVKSNTAPMDPARVEEEKQKLLDFAQCMRDHGIDFPDPQISTDGGGLQVQLGGPGLDADAPAFKEANDACSAQVGMPQPGSGPGGGVSTGTGADTKAAG